MTMPIDLVLVRHGQSEGNLANERSRHGDHSAFTDEFNKRHSSTWRLTDRGIRQAQAAGLWIYHNMVLPFDRHYTSDYVRAKETAANLDLPFADWYIEGYLRERDYGELDVMQDDLRRANYQHYLDQRVSNPFYSIPPNGEAMITTRFRVDRGLLGTLHRECSDKRVIVVCHGEVIYAVKMSLERLTEEAYRALMDSDDQSTKIYNGQIFHYTRHDPGTGKLARHANWVRTIRPLDPDFPTDWREIKRPKYSNEDLLEMVSRIPRMVNSD